MQACLRSPRPYHGLPELHYPLNEREVLVTACSRIRMHQNRINISTVLAGQRVGIKEVADDVWLVTPTSASNLHSACHSWWYCEDSKSVIPWIK